MPRVVGTLNYVVHELEVAILRCLPSYNLWRQFQTPRVWRMDGTWMAAVSFFCVMGTFLTEEEQKTLFHSWAVIDCRSAEEKLTNVLFLKKFNKRHCVEVQHR